MQELNSNPTPGSFPGPFSLDHLATDAIVSHPEYLSGFDMGIDAYESECEVKGRTLTGHEVCRNLCRDLAPSARVRAIREQQNQLLDIQPDPWFESGFHAGWIFAHLQLSAAPAAAATLRDMQPMSVLPPCYPRVQ